jgi:DMSO/TMAO reductase YedYZ molybdopterin-dependent catalytic subunit
MSQLLTRRKLIVTGLKVAAGASGLVAAADLANRYGLIPPDHTGIYGVGETLTYVTQRVLSSHYSRVREFNRSEISKSFPVIGPPPENELYQRYLAGGFADWRLMVDGLVARPTSFSLTDLKGLPCTSQVTLHVCEQGWSAIAEWAGVSLINLLDLVGTLPNAKYVLFFAYDKWDDGNPEWESIDMSDALHPQTLLAYAMNGHDLPAPHGAPLRLRLPRQVGFKSVKYLHHITVVDSVRNLGKGLGGVNAEEGYSWFAGI